MARYFAGTNTEVETISVKRLGKNFEKFFWCHSCDCDGAVVQIDFTAHCDSAACDKYKIGLCQDCFERLKKKINEI